MTLEFSQQLDRYTAPNADFVLVAAVQRVPYSGPRRAKRAKEILAASQGRYRDIKGSALGWMAIRSRERSVERDKGL
jgi:hypothetical protein